MHYYGQGEFCELGFAVLINPLRYFLARRAVAGRASLLDYVAMQYRIIIDCVQNLAILRKVENIGNAM